MKSTHNTRSSRVTCTAVVTATLVLLGITALSYALNPPAAGDRGGSSAYTLNHQGVVQVGGLRFEGDGYFRFALVDPDSGNNAWTNDGTHVGETTMPDSAISLPVVGGIYTVRLGDDTLPNMTAISPAIFGDDNLVMRIWFNDGASGIQQLTPDQPLSSTPYAMHAANGVPAGTIVAFGGVNPPTGWLLCDGNTVSRTERQTLFDAIGAAWGAGDGATTFHLPDLRGRFLRGRDGGAGRDPDAEARTACNAGGGTGGAVGSVQEDELGRHDHGVTDPGHSHSFTMGVGDSGPRNIPADGDVPDHVFSTNSAATGITINNNGGDETRPKNAYVNYIIKY